MATTNNLDFVYIVILVTVELGLNVSFLIGNHQPIGAARAKRVSVLDDDHRVPGSRRSHGSEGLTSSTRTFTRAFMTTKINVCL